MDKIQEEIERRFDLDNNSFLTVLSGSQNYKMADDNSDIDTKTYVFPTLADIASGDRPKSVEKIMEDGSHNTVKDVRLFVPMLLKQGINFTECLQTQWYKVNSNYADYWNTLKQLTPRITHYDERRTCMGALGTLQSNDVKVRKLAEQGKVDGKALSNVLRMYYFIYHYINGCGFEQCIIPSDHDRLLHIKRCGADEFTPDEALRISTSNREKAVDLVLNASFKKVDDRLRDLLYNINQNLMEDYLRDRLA